MCGLVVMVGDVPATIRGAAVRGAGARGPHSWGVAGWRSSLGEWGAMHAAGRLTRLPVGPNIVVGHSRLATSTALPGDRPDPAEGQPFVDGRYMVAHNGTLDAAEQGLWPAVPDSRSLLLSLSGEPSASPDERLANTRAPQSAVWSDGVHLYCGRWDGGGVPAHPLWCSYEGDAGKGRIGWMAVSSGYFPTAALVEAGARVDLGELHDLQAR